MNLIGIRANIYDAIRFSSFIGSYGFIESIDGVAILRKNDGVEAEEDA